MNIRKYKTNSSPTIGGIYAIFFPVSQYLCTMFNQSYNNRPKYVDSTEFCDEEFKGSQYFFISREFRRRKWVEFINYKSPFSSLNALLSPTYLANKTQINYFKTNRIYILHDPAVQSFVLIQKRFQSLIVMSSLTQRLMHTGPRGVICDLNCS